MTWTLDYSNSNATVTPVLGTETTLIDGSSYGITNASYQFYFDTSNMALGDVTEINIYQQLLSANDTGQVRMFHGAWSNVQANNIKISPPFSIDQTTKITILQRGGTITLTTLTGTVPYGVVGTGQTTGATCIVYPPGGGNVSGTSTGILVTSATAFNSSEIVWCTTSSNEYTMNAAPNGRAYYYKLLRM